MENKANLADAEADLLFEKKQENEKKNKSSKYASVKQKYKGLLTS